MKRRQLVMVAGLIVAAGLAFFGDKTPSSNISEPVARDAKAVKSAHVIKHKVKNGSITSNKAMRFPDILVLHERDTLIGGVHKSSGRVLFGSKNWTPPPPPPSKPLPPQPPMAPPLPFTYIGKKFDGTSWEVYVMRGEQTFIVREDTVLENTYHMDSIKPPLLTLTYLPLQQVQILTIGGPD